MDHFNELTPAEAERLALLMEECGEVVQVIGKILRHGYESYHPADPNGPTNRELLENELGDLWFAMDFVADNDLRPSEIARAHNEKRGKVGRYLHHQAATDSVGVVLDAEPSPSEPGENQ